MYSYSPAQISGTTSGFTKYQGLMPSQSRNGDLCETKWGFPHSVNTAQFWLIKSFTVLTVQVRISQKILEVQLRSTLSHIWHGIRKTQLVIENLLMSLMELEATWKCLRFSQATQAIQCISAGLMSHLMKNWSSDFKWYQMPPSSGDISSSIKHI